MVDEQPRTDQEAYFLERLDRGDRIEAEDWMPEDYRQQLVRLIAMHAVSEIMGALPEKEWVPRAPTLYRKLAITAKVQDEMGHGQLLIRVAEDLMAPWGKTRQDIMDDLFSGRLKYHNVFHMATPTWADAGIIGWLVDGAAVITQGMSLSCSYAPYARALTRIVEEEGFHIQHGESICLALAEGTPRQRAMLQDALNRWWPALLMFFGPPEKSQLSTHQLRNIRYRIRSKTNEELRQRFFTKYVHRIWSLGLTIPDPTLQQDPTSKEWHYQQPDWEEFRRIVNNHGPRSQARLGLRSTTYEEGAWVRRAIAETRSRAV
jgi:ring-1,2-phenylacetyl-CoA epoxidase subunit PaaA